MAVILRISDVIARRAQQQREVEFYLDQKARLEARLEIVRRELRLTDDILKVIRAEIHKI